MKRALWVIALGLLLHGCANLDEVRQFAGESAKLSAYTELTTHFRDTYAREYPYLAESNLAVAQANDQKRQAAYGDLLKVHETVSRYMMTLATLAGETTFDLSKDIDALSGKIKAYPDLGLDSKHVDAVAGVAQLLAKWTTSYVQSAAVKDMVRAGDQPIQMSLDGLSRLLRVYRKTHENERKNVLGLFETEFALARVQSKDPLLTALARTHYEGKVTEFALVDRKFDAAERAIKGIANGHAELYQNVNDLSATELKEGLSALVKDLKALSQQLQAFR